MSHFCKVSDAESQRWSEALERNTDREMANFQRLLPGLLLTHKNQFVAVSEGQVLDNDFDELELAERVLKKHKGKFVLIHKVEEIPLDEKKNQGQGR